MFNLLLLLLPAVLLSLSVYYYGRPIAERFKDFLGNPITEFVSISRHFDRQPFPLQLYEHSNQVLGQMAAREELDESSRQQLREAFFRIHRATVSRIPHDDDDFFELYQELLVNPQLQRFFPHPRQLRSLLNEDLQRLQRLQDLPFHPAEGLDAYLEPVPKVVDTVIEYGQIYGDRYTCRNVYGSDCSAVHEPAVEISSHWIGQYLQTWPELGDRGRRPIEVLAERLEELVVAYGKLSTDIEDYLNATPWTAHQELLENHDNFQNNFREELHRWYSRAVQDSLYETDSFLAAPVDEIKTAFDALQSIEEQIQTSAATRRLLLTENTEAIRRQAAERLTVLLHQLLAHRRFGPDFEVEEDKIDRLVTTLEVFPGGTDQIDRQRELLAEIEEHHSQLVDATEEKQYSNLYSLLEESHNQLSRAEFRGWEIMKNYFLEKYLPELSSPQFQPVHREEQEIYVGIIEQLERINNFLELEQISPEWREETLLALRSQRFSQLKSEIINQLQHPRAEEIQTVISNLEEITALPELPDALAGEPAQIVFHASLIEKITLDSDNIYRNFLEEVELLAIEKDLFDVLEDIVATTNSSAEELLLEVNLEEFAEQSVNWLQNFRGNDQLLQLLHSHYVQLLEDLYARLAGRAVGWTEDTTAEAPSLEELVVAHQNLDEALEVSGAIEGFSSPYSAQNWLNLTALRERLTNILQAIEALERGGLFRENEPFQNFVSLAENYRYRALPSGYRFNYERQLTGIIQEELVEKAREIEDISRGDWFAGWGGRIRGEDVLVPWIDFLHRLEREVEVEVFNRHLEELINRASATKEQLEAGQ